MKKIGILGGTFDPVHNAHLDLAQAALDQYGLDVVLFVPTGMPVRKLGKTQAGAQDRLSMLRAACENKEGFEVSSMEVDRPGVTYTIDTLRELKALYRNESRLYLILGEDTATDLATWKDARELAALAGVLYAKRPGGSRESRLPEGFTCSELLMEVCDISSSGVRELLQKGSDVSNFVPTRVSDYIEEHGLYGRS
jgi:nicotinate-nucleotide adenylyltransferase